MATDVRNSKAYRKLKASLTEALKARGMDLAVYADKVEEYLDFWVLRQKLRADIDERGLTVTDERGRVSENRSISLEIQVSRQMLALFTAMGFRLEDLKGGAVDDDEL